MIRAAPAMEKRRAARWCGADVRSMITVALEDAQARLPELIAGARRGEEVVLTEKEQPVVKLVAIAAEPDRSVRRPTFGSAKGMFIEREDCWEPDVEVWKEYMP